MSVCTYSLDDKFSELNVCAYSLDKFSGLNNESGLKR